MGEYSVSKKQLEELLSACKEVLNDHNKADGLLPTVSGFFFGNTEYDEYYYDSLERTTIMLDKILGETNPNQDIYYSSSW